MPALDATYCNTLALKHHVQFVTGIFQSDRVTGTQDEVTEDTKRQAVTGSDQGFCSAVATEWINAERNSNDVRESGTWTTYLADPVKNRALMYAIQMGNTNIHRAMNQRLQTAYDDLVARQQKRDLHQSGMQSSLGYFATFASQVVTNLAAKASIMSNEPTDGDLRNEYLELQRNETQRRYQLTFFKSYDPNRQRMIIHDYGFGTSARTVLEDAPLGGFSFIEIHMDKGGHGISVRRRGANDNTSQLVDANSGVWQGTYGNLVDMFEEFWTEIYAAGGWVARSWKLVEV